MKKSEFFVTNEIELLELTLDRFNISEREYAIFEEKDEAVCLNCLFDYWVTYYLEKGAKTSFKAHETFNEACDEVFKAFSDNKEEHRAMKKYFDVFNIQLNEIGVYLDKAEDYIPKTEQVDIEREPKIRTKC